MDGQFNGTVLIVEDDAVAGKLLNQQLEMHGFQSLLAPDAASARQFFDTNNPQAVLLDLHLPDTHGLQLLKELNSKNPHVPIIITSGNDDLIVIQDAYANGATDYFIKPIHGFTLGHRLKYFIENSQINRMLKENSTSNSSQSDAWNIVEEKLLHLTHRDATTDLPNRRAFMQMLDNAILTTTPDHNSIAVILLDLDHFKRINESLDHVAGDHLLKNFTLRLQEKIGQITHSKDFISGVVKTSIARVDGDEFAILLIGKLNNQKIAKFTESLHTCLEQPFQIENQEIKINLHAGIALFPQDGQTPLLLMKNSEIALHHAKSHPLHWFQFYNDAINRVTQHKLKLESDLHRALKRKEFVLYYQPKVEVASGKLVGVETLIRWVHPTLGMIPPDEFIRIAEESNLIIPIGEWVLQTACQQAKAWQEHYKIDLQMAVNISSKQFCDPDFVDKVANILNATEIPANTLDLELTENLLFKSDSNNRSIISKLKQLGISISIDDFGTGYSSLRYLSHFQIDTIKIDRSFLLEANEHNHAIIEAVVNLGHSLNLSVVAEGVESVFQYRFLQQTHCDYAQGYLFSRPLPESEIEKLLTHPPDWAITSMTNQPINETEAMS